MGARPNLTVLPGAIASIEECVRVASWFAFGDPEQPTLPAPGGAAVHKGWLHAMRGQQRAVAPDRQVWDELHKQDRELDAAIAKETAIAFLLWLAHDAVLTHRDFGLTLPLIAPGDWPMPESDGMGDDTPFCLEDLLDDDHRSMIADWVIERGAEACFQAWRDNMVIQARWLASERRHWDVLPARDRTLFAHVAAWVILAFWAWLVENVPA